jgi:hypothetical protein
MKAVLIWLLVIIPLSWGVTQSVKKAIPLFHADAPAAAGK